MTRRQYSGGGVRTTITGSIAASGGGTVTIAAATGWPDGSVGKFAVIVDPGLSSEEKILVDSLTGTTLSYSSGGRGYDGSSATSHSSGATIWLCATSIDFDEANSHINATVAAHAASAISYTAGGTIAATTVQGAISELDSETDARLDLIEANDWVTSARILDGTIATGDLANDAVTPKKINIYYASTGARTADNGSPSTGDLSYVDSGGADEGVEIYNGTAWRPPWNLPWGVYGYAQVTANQGSITTITDLTSLSVTFTAVANRRVRVVGYIEVTSTVLDGAFELFITDGSNTAIKRATGPILSTTAAVTVPIEIVVTPGAGSVTYKLRLQRTSGSGTYTMSAGATNPAFICVEDIGPAGAPA